RAGPTHDRTPGGVRAGPSGRTQRRRERRGGVLPGEDRHQPPDADAHLRTGLPVRRGGPPLVRARPLPRGEEVLRPRGHDRRPHVDPQAGLRRAMTRLRLAWLALALAPVAGRAAEDPPSWLREAAARSVPAYDAQVPAVELFDERDVTVEADGRTRTVQR